MITIGLIGDAGQLGLCLQDVAYNMKDVRFVYYDRNQTDFLLANAGTVIYQITKQEECDVIINVSGYTNVDLAEKDVDLAFKVNWHAPAMLALICTQIGIPLIHVSTDYVFDGRKNGSYVETDKTNPLSVYGLSKLAGELAVASVQPKSLIIRTSWMFSGYRRNFLKTMLQLGQKQDAINVVANEHGTPTYAPDLARAVLVAARSAVDPAFKDWGIFHYGGNRSVTRYAYAQEIFRSAKNEGFKTPQSVVPIGSDEFPLPAVRPENSSLSSNKFESVFDVPPSDWVAGIQETLQQLKKGEIDHGQKGYRSCWRSGDTSASHHKGDQ